MIVNLNVMCKVQLNELGKSIWMSQINNIPEDVKASHPDIVDVIEKSIDEYDCVEAELWGIMGLFGPYISQTQSPFRVNTFELKKNINFKNPS